MKNARYCNVMVKCEQEGSSVVGILKAFPFLRFYVWKRW